MSRAADLSAHYLAPSEAGRRLGVSRWRIRDLVDSGRLPAVLTPLGRLVPTEAVEAEARRRGIAAEARRESEEGERG